jgi:hypothetical protein
VRIEGLWAYEAQAQGQVRFLFEVWANYRMVFKAVLKKIKAKLKRF